MNTHLDAHLTVRLGVTAEATATPTEMDIRVAVATAAALVAMVEGVSAEVPVAIACPTLVRT